MKKLFKDDNYIFPLSPALIIIFFVGIVPLIFQIYISLHSFNLGFGWSTKKFVGIDNYIRFLSDSSFLDSVLLTVYFTLLVTFISLIIGILFSLIINRKFKFKPLIVISILIPQTIAPSIIGLIWKLMYNSEYGVFNYFLEPFGLDQIWLGSKWAFASIVITSVWYASSFMTLVVLSGLESLPQEPYEAAAIDGASKFQAFFQITLPMLKPILGIAVLLQQVACLHIFGIVFTLTGGGPGERTNLLALEIYKTGLDIGNVGLGAGIANILVILALIMSSIYIKAMGEEF